MDEEGCVFIKWVDRTVSKVKPQELYKVDTEVRFLLELRGLQDLFILKKQCWVSRVKGGC